MICALRMIYPCHPSPSLRMTEKRSEARNHFQRNTMKQLLSSTIAYRLIGKEAQADRLSNAYLLTFADEVNLRLALKECASLFFNGDARIERETHPDCIILPESGKALTKEDAEKILEESLLSPVEGGKKLFVLDNMQKCSPVIQNKLLKVLEEPPENVHFLLGTTAEYPILSTVKSRAKKLEIPPFSIGEVYDCLTRLYGENADLMGYAEASDGVVGRAMNLYQGGRYKELYEKALAVVSAEKGDIPVACRALSFVAEKTDMVGMLARTYRDMLLYKTKQATPTGEHAERIKKLSEKFSLSSLILALELMAEAEKEITFNAPLASCVEVAMMKIDKEKRK